LGGNAFENVFEMGRKNGYSAKIIEISPAEEAGIKNVTFTICGVVFLWAFKS